MNDINEVNADEKQALLENLEEDEGIDLGAIFVAYGIFFLVILVFMPKIYLANNIYYASRDINYLQAQKEALKNENSELQQQLESTKFNFLTLDIEEIK
ncbi:hypothetical protein CCY99_02665 [Helicobacter sp. 16-1353]|uniref:hypothetical protein n=1 Tax=Helicobacter sp. 16-1353 TaxID=2004996 RepID=UPI000DCC99A1|nr:hypothetical protein [Helicobacter sp. 16-1353]RAX54683.1 hypothetical protein CCY99_02665 [Helicobacter sp. 16-1353]